MIALLQDLMLGGGTDVRHGNMMLKAKS